MGLRLCGEGFEQAGLGGGKAVGGVWGAGEGEDEEGEGEGDVGLGGDV